MTRSSEIRALIARDLPVIEKETEELTGARSRLENEEKEIEQKIAALQPFTTIPVDIDLLRGYRTLAVYAGYTVRDVVPAIPHERFYSPSKGGNFIVVIVPVEYRSEVENALSEAMFQQVTIPEENGPAGDAIRRYRARMAAIKQSLADIAITIEENKKKHADFLVACNELLTSDIQKAEAPLRFATTDQAFVAEGWVPANEVAGLMKAIDQVTGGKSYVTEFPIDLEHDIVPMEYQNPAYSRPTQFIMDIYSRPGYREIDPTLIVSIVFPLFFGLILGDVGYGLMLLVLGLVLRRVIRKGDGAQLVNILIIFGIFSIIFGALYSEFLGFKMPWEPLVYSRHMNIGGEGGAGAAIPELLVVSIWIGDYLHHPWPGIKRGQSCQDGPRLTSHQGSDGKFWLDNGHVGTAIAMIWSFFPIPLMPDLTRFPPLVAGLNIAAVAGA